MTILSLDCNGAGNARLLLLCENSERESSVIKKKRDSEKTNKENTGKVSRLLATDCQRQERERQPDISRTRGGVERTVKNKGYERNCQGTRRENGRIVGGIR